MTIQMEVSVPVKIDLPDGSFGFDLEALTKAQKTKIQKQINEGVVNEINWNLSDYLHDTVEKDLEEVLKEIDVKTLVKKEVEKQLPKIIEAFVEDICIDPHGC